MLKPAITVIAIIAFVGCSSASFYGPMHTASVNGDADAIAKLVKRGFDINSVGAHGMTPLINAAYYGYTPTIRELLRFGANPNAQDDNKWSALHYAANTGRADIAKVLIEAGADPYLEDLWGKNAIQIAKEWDERSGRPSIMHGFMTGFKGTIVKPMEKP